MQRNSSGGALLALALGAACLATPASAQEAPASAQDVKAPPSETERVVCTELRNLDQPLTKQQLDTARLCQEIAKIREEVRTVETTNRASSTPFFGWLIPWAGAVTGILTVLFAAMVPAAGFVAGSSFQTSQKKKLEQEEKKLEQERILQRDGHNLELLKGVGSSSRAVQLASISSLLRRIEEILRSNAKDGHRSSEYRTIADIVVSVLRDPEIDDSVAKYLADQMVKVLGMRTSAATTGGGDALAANLRDFNLQQTRLFNVDWADVSAEGVDFFQANLSKASLRRANLAGAVLYEADLRDAVLVDANMKGANLQGADLRGARLSGTDFSGAVHLDKAVIDKSTTWDERTIWPAEFTPRVDVSSA